MYWAIKGGEQLYIERVVSEGGDIVKNYKEFQENHAFEKDKIVILKIKYKYTKQFLLTRYSQLFFTFIHLTVYTLLYFLFSCKFSVVFTFFVFFFFWQWQLCTTTCIEFHHCNHDACFHVSDHDLIRPCAWKFELWSISPWQQPLPWWPLPCAIECSRGIRFRFLLFCFILENMERTETTINQYLSPLKWEN